MTLKTRRYKLINRGVKLIRNCIMIVNNEKYKPFNTQPRIVYDQ